MVKRSGQEEEEARLFILIDCAAYLRGRRYGTSDFREAAVIVLSPQH